MSRFNSEITIASPFPAAEQPALFCWMKRMWPSVADDSMPTELSEWMQYQFDRTALPNLQTWAVYRGQQIGGYVEAVYDHADFRGDNLIGGIGQALIRMVFQKEMWGQHNTLPALNLVLRDVFGANDLALFPVLARNRPIRDLVGRLGASEIGRIGAGVTQDDEPIDLRLYCLSGAEWEEHNQEFLHEHRQATAEPPVAEAVMAGE